mmetsp:Transcript_67467/g.119271  ORF Transcript_67467/g.119271 Transcript_67467/m.119271 type:complete len:1376 (+) Transcript_67467:3-4130(+)
MDSFMGSGHMASPKELPVAEDGIATAWTAEVKEKGLLHASMAVAIYKAIGPRICITLLLCSWAAAFLEFVGMVLALDFVLSSLEDAKLAGPAAGGLVPAVKVIGLLFVLPVLYRCLSVVVTMLDAQCVRLVTTGLCSLLYEKALRLPAGAAYHLDGAVGEENSGRRLTKMLSAGVAQEWPQVFRTIALFSAAPFVAAALVVVLVKHLGLPALAGSLYMVPAVVMATLAVRWALCYRNQYQRNQNSRLRGLAELLSKRKALQALGWEAVFHHRIQESRQGELFANQAYSVAVGVLVANLHAITWLVAVGSLTVSALVRHDLDGRNVWVVLQIVSSLQTCANLAMSGLRRAMCLPASLARIECFLKQPEKPADVLRRPGIRDGDPLIRISGSFAFEEGGPAVLHKLDLSLHSGEMVAVIGGTGSGKSALLLTLLGELFPCGLAFVSAPSDSAYCAESPWLFHGSLQQNILLLGPPSKNKRRYEEALAAASLLPEVANLPGGDEALIDNLNLSVSQRAKLVLARTAYGNAQVEKATDVMLIDDILGALPPEEAQEVLEKLLSAPHVNGRTRLVVMSQPSADLLQLFDRVLVLRDGHVIANGPPSDVMAGSLWQCTRESPRNSDLEGTLPSEIKVPKSGNLGEICPAISGEPNSEAKEAEVAPEALPYRSLSVLGRALLGNFQQEKASCRAAAGALLVTEDDELSNWEVLLIWIRAGGWCNLSLALFLLLLQRATQLWQMLTLAWWGDSAMTSGCNHRAFAASMFFIVALNCKLMVGAEWASSRFARAAAEDFHDRALHATLQTPWYRFGAKHDEALDKMSVDLAQVDSAMMSLLLTGCRSAAGTLLQQAYILSIAPLWVAVGVLLPLYICVGWFGFLYLQAAMTLLSHSKGLFSHAENLLDQTVPEHVSVRTNGASQMFCGRYSACTNSAGLVSFMLSAASKSWVCLRATFCLSIGATTCALHVLLSESFQHVGVGTLGLVVSFLFAFLTDFESSCDLLAQGGIVLGALRRMKLYIDECLLREQPPKLGVGVGRALTRRITLDSKDLVPLWLQSSQAADPIIAGLDGRPLLGSSEGGCALACLGERRFKDLAPGGAAFCTPESLCGHVDEEGAAEDFMLIAVNNVSFDAQAMASALVGASGRNHDSTKVVLELRHKSCVLGAGVQAHDLYAGYGNAGPAVLKGLKLNVPAARHVAVIGVPSSGKSTLLACLAGMLEPRAGQVLVAGQARSQLELQSLLGLVPQEPAIFEGTWRENIDLRGRCSDDEIWIALKAVGLDEHVSNRPTGLGDSLAQDGENLSGGQKQLLGLARLVLSRPPVLLIDGCTAGLDPMTCQIIELTLASCFHKSTVIAATSSKGSAMILGFQNFLQLKSGRADPS